IAPGCTLNIIRDASVHEKFRLHMPPKIYNFEEISCKNENCISHPEKHQHVKTHFNRSSDSKFVCKYCEKSHSFEEIWDI
ncbi:MAG: bifunctional aspartate carbamoyltransferase catalytic subunit/aspartate carbamoyltransferase regulatory subunit, partial [Spirochaetales bacterium]|nr:bifunctional aspartate carbamoyltransferase catalytic subunit/aspartate carbamoyltransferase regulatory subunit [Spirochaetales bacterium]